MTHVNRIKRDVYRNMLIAWRLLNRDGAIHYSAEVPTTRWGDAITRLLAERGWTKRQLAEAASVRPNTITNIIKHGRDADTATLARLAAALKVDIAELFLTREQSVILHAHRENRVERLRDQVVRELSDTVNKLVTQELERIGEFSEAEAEAIQAKASATKRGPAKRRTPTKKR
ncbi:MAG: helix-turn-helix domain-containing protein [Vicinamibacterales bacterium]